VLLNPANVPSTKSTSQEVREAARVLGLETQFLNATTVSEIDTAFAMLAGERADALFVAPDGFLASRRVQLATLTARERMPTSYASREYVEAGGLMSYGTNIAETFRQVGVYTGSILKRTKPADLPVQQSTRFEFVINLTTAKALGLSVPPTLIAIADEVIQ
jgi:putative ABC transport system substrate-binding protein